MIDPVLKYSGSYSTSREIFRTTLYQYDMSNKLMWDFEVWASSEAIEDALRISTPITKQDLWKFAQKIYHEYMSECDYKPEHRGVFVTSKGKFYGNPDTFPGSVSGQTEEGLIQTNISLPKKLHKEIKEESVRKGMSMSELIRTSLVQYKKRHFICSKCSEEKLGDPMIVYQNGQDCRECFLKAFEN